MQPSSSTSSTFTSSHLRDALKAVKYPGFSRDIVSFGLVQKAEIVDGVAHITLLATSSDAELPGRLKAAVAAHLSTIPEIRDVSIDVELKDPTVGSVTYPTAHPPALSKVKHVIAVASGKGGVGKSTFSVNLACALSRLLEAQGKPHRVGIMDSDIYGPSIPLMMGISGRPEVNAQSQLIPMENFGIRVMSMGFLIDETAPVVWRGPMVTKTIQQFSTSVAWEELEVLVVDLPPGTGDAQLTLAQSIPLKGAVIVTTPQTAASLIATRGAMMFEKVNTPLLGVVENMSYFVEPTTRQRLSLFGDGGGELTAEALGTPLLGQIPLEPQIRQGADHGIPLLISHPENPASLAILEIAQKILTTLNHS